MKIIMLFILLLSSMEGFSQKKGKEDPKDAIIDSLTKVTISLSSKLDSTMKADTMLSMKLDSVSKDRNKYYAVYTSLKDKVVMHDFDPAKTPLLIDSLKASREATQSGLKATSAALSDSLSVLKKENSLLKDSVAKMEASKLDKEKLIAELKQLKELLDAKIITQQEYDLKKTKIMEKW